MPHYFVVYKPYQVLCQFSPSENKQTLANIFQVPKDVYPVGRLDYDSEGLLILTNDKRVNHHLLHPSFAHPREYWAQVEGVPSTENLDLLQKGVLIRVDQGSYHTRPCQVFLQSEEPCVPTREPPIRYRKTVPTSWLKLILTEGKNRQVRKMTAAIGHPTLRLIRYRIASLSLQGMQPGDIIEYPHLNFL